ncbi:MAG: hypothetical protein JSS68_05805 [Actinobacteria bacterium]|nr:hypothetical protein [Actinomycetota bacterium]
MQTNPIGGRTTEAEDHRTERAVLSRVVDLHPTHLTLEELLLDQGAEDQGSLREGLERAIRDLTAAGLLRLDGESILPTRAALRAEEIAI